MNTWLLRSLGCALFGASLSCQPWKTSTRADAVQPDPAIVSPASSEAHSSKAASSQSAAEGIDVDSGSGGALNPSAAADAEWGCGLPEELRSRGWPRMLEPLRAGQPPLPQAGARTLVVLPDTQYYVACRSAHLADQVEYVLEQLEARKIALVLTVGDLTDHNTDDEWQFFRQAVGPLLERVPLILTTGNHDHGAEGGARTRGSGLVRTFGRPPEKSRALLAAVPPDGNWENAYYRLPLGKNTLGVLTLEWSPREASVKWAAGVLDRYPEDRLVFSTHAYLYHDDTRYDWERFQGRQEWSPRAYGTARLDPARDPGPGNWGPEGAYDGEMLWQRLLGSRPGLWLTLNGHVLVDGQGYLASRGESQNLVHQMLVNFQMLNHGGSGFLRLLQIAPDGRTLSVFTYSPSMDRTATGPGEQFTVALDPPLEL